MKSAMVLGQECKSLEFSMALDVALKHLNKL